MQGGSFTIEKTKLKKFVKLKCIKYKFRNAAKIANICHCAEFRELNRRLNKGTFYYVKLEEMKLFVLINS